MINGYVGQLLAPSHCGMHSTAQRYQNFVRINGWTFILFGLLLLGGYYYQRYYRWRRKWQLTPVLLPGKFHGRKSLVGYSPWGRKESDTTGWLHSLTQGYPHNSGANKPWKQKKDTTEICVQVIMCICISLHLDKVLELRLLGPMWYFFLYFYWSITALQCC